VRSLNTTPRDSRLRRFRTAAYAVHLMIITVFIGLMALSVIRSVSRMTPPRQRSSKSTLSRQLCADKAEAYWRELDGHRQNLTQQFRAQRSDLQWLAFRLDWLRRLRQSEMECAIDAADRVVIKDLFKRLERLMDLYTTHAVQFAGEIGGTVDDFRGHLAAARKQNEMTSDSAK
jgi:hypothetical protein